MQCENETRSQTQQITTIMKKSIKGTRTEKNLAISFAGESQARMRYTYFASVAKKEGYEQISAIFTETADQELKAAAAGENEEWSLDYPRFADIADEEGFPAIAKMYREIAVAEKGHEERYRAFVKNIEEGKVFKKDVETVWQCRNCGYVHVGTEAPETCPACLHPQAYFEVKKNNY